MHLRDGFRTDAGKPLDAQGIEYGAQIVVADAKLPIGLAEIDAGRSVAARIRRRIAPAIAPGSPSRRRQAVTSRNASSSDSPSTRGVKTRKMANTCPEIS
jgi:hypothetical protein